MQGPFQIANGAAPPVSVSVLTFNRCALLRKSLHELLELTYRPLQILVVDNHSQDGTPEMMRREFPQVTYFYLEQNIGAAGRNVGMQKASGDIVVTLDDDVMGLADGGIRALATKFVDDPKLGAVNFRVMNTAGQVCNWVHHCREENFFDQQFLTYEITEGAVAFRKLALEASGYYAEDFFLSHEGPDLAFRIFERGFTVMYSGEICVTHHFAEEGRKPWRNYYYDTRNQFWLAARNFPWSYAFSYLARGLAAMLVYSIRDGYFRYWLKAMRDGLWGVRRATAGRRVLSKATMEVVKKIDSQRPKVGYLIRKRLFTRDGLLFK
jgi:GT2 family glycosyltransferase